jgi:hypothetical protein
VSVCDGSLLTLICTIPSAYFTTSTNYNLLWGASVFARVAATNIRGTSLVSAAGNGAVIVKLPDSPVSLSASSTTATQTSLTWLEGSFNGGAPIIDYRLWSDQGTGSFILLQSSILTTSFTVTGLTAGLTYKFKVNS